MRILFLSAWYPFPPNNGSRIRIYNLLRGLAERHDITLLSFADQPNCDPNVPELRQLCSHIELLPLKQFNPTGLHARLGFLSRVPRSVVDTYSPEMTKRIQELAKTTDFDLVIASQTRMAGYVDAFTDLPAIFDEVEISLLHEDYAQAKGFKQRLRAGLTWFKHRQYLTGLLKRFQISTVASEQEKQLLLQNVPYDASRVVVIPNCIDVAAYELAQTAPQPNTLIYTGSFSYFPNHEAMVWFIERVLPLVQVEIPNVQLTITGNKAKRPLPPSDHVRHVGFVDDIAAYVATSWISLAPIWSGGGTRLKILEAMALRTPVIATSKGAEGIDARPDEHILIADTPEDFAAAVIRLLQEPSLRKKLTDNAYHLVSEKYDWTTVAPQMQQLIERIAHEN